MYTCIQLLLQGEAVSSTKEKEKEALQRLDARLEVMEHSHEDKVRLIGRYLFVDHT